MVTTSQGHRQRQLWEPVDMSAQQPARIVNCGFPKQAWNLR